MQTENKINRGGRFPLYFLKFLESIADGIYIVGSIFVGLFLLGFTFSFGLPLLLLTFSCVAVFSALVLIQKIWDEITRRQSLADWLSEEEKVFNNLLEGLDVKYTEPALRKEKKEVIREIANKIAEIDERDKDAEKKRKEKIKRLIVMQLSLYEESNDDLFKKKLKDDICLQIRRSNTNQKNKLFTDIPTKPTRTMPAIIRDKITFARAEVTVTRDSLQVTNAVRIMLRAVGIKIKKIIQSPYTKAAGGLAASLVFGGPMTVGVAVIIGVVLVASTIITGRSERKIDDKIESVANETRILNHGVTRLNCFQNGFYSGRNVKNTLQVTKKTDDRRKRLAQEDEIRDLKLELAKARYQSQRDIAEDIMHRTSSAQEEQLACNDKSINEPVSSSETQIIQQRFIRSNSLSFFTSSGLIEPEQMRRNSVDSLSFNLPYQNVCYF